MSTQDDTDANSQPAPENASFQGAEHIVKDLENQAEKEQWRAKSAQTFLISSLAFVIVLFLVFERIVIPIQAEWAEANREEDQASVLRELTDEDTATQKALYLAQREVKKLAENIRAN